MTTIPKTLNLSKTVSSLQWVVKKLISLKFDTLSELTREINVFISKLRVIKSVCLFRNRLLNKFDLMVVNLKSTIVFSFKSRNQAFSNDLQIWYLTMFFRKSSL